MQTATRILDAGGDPEAWASQVEVLQDSWPAAGGLLAGGSGCCWAQLTGSMWLLLADGVRLGSNQMVCTLLGLGSRALGGVWVTEWSLMRWRQAAMGCRWVTSSAAWPVARRLCTHVTCCSRPVAISNANGSSEAHDRMQTLGLTLTLTLTVTALESSSSAGDCTFTSAQMMCSYVRACVCVCYIARPCIVLRWLQSSYRSTGLMPSSW